MTPRLDLIDTFSGFQGLEGEWNALVAASSANNLFLTWEWVSLWWDVYGAGQTLHIVTVRDHDGHLLGIAPLKRRRITLLGVGVTDVVEFLGCGGDVTPERLDFIVRAGHEAVVAPLVVRHLLAHAGAQGLDLRPFAAGSPNLPHLRAGLQEARGSVRERPDSVCPVLPLPATWEAFLQGRSRNYRKKMGEYQRRCAKEYGAHVRQSATSDEVRRDMSALVDLHHKRWEGQSRSFQTSRYIEFHHRLAQRFLETGWVRLFVLESADRPLAVLYCFAYDRRYYYYQAGRDPAYAKHRVGLVLMHHAMEQAIGEGVAVFDFLRGREEYKYLWAADDVTSVRLTHWKSWPSRVAERLAMLVRHAQSGVSASWLGLLGGGELG